MFAIQVEAAQRGSATWEISGGEEVAERIRNEISCRMCLGSAQIACVGKAVTADNSSQLYARGLSMV